MHTTKPVTLFRTKSEAAAAIGALSDTSKMPGKSWGISATLCHTGAKLAKRPGSICSSCYACKGSYTMYPAVAAAHAKRLSAYLADPAQWRAAMVKLITGQQYFRWFDSGDVQSPAMALDILAIADSLPDVRFWIASREVAFWRDALAVRPLPANVTLRMSAAFPDTDHVPGQSLTGTVALVHTGEPQAGAHACPAPQQGGQCGACRACWSRDVAAVTYRAH